MMRMFLGKNMVVVTVSNGNAFSQRAVEPCARCRHLPLHETHPLRPLSNGISAPGIEAKAFADSLVP